MLPVRPPPIEPSWPGASSSSSGVRRWTGPFGWSSVISSSSKSESDSDETNSSLLSLFFFVERLFLTGVFFVGVFMTRPLMVLFVVFFAEILAVLRTLARALALDRSSGVFFRLFILLMRHFRHVLLDTTPEVSVK